MCKITLTISGICRNQIQYILLARGGKLWDMTDILDEYASDLTKKCINSDGGAMLEAAKVDGKLYGIPTGNAQRIPSQFLWVRKDWLARLNLEVPKTLDDVIAVARAFKNNDPDGNGADDTWGLGLCKEMSDFAGFGTVEGIVNAYGSSILQYIWLKNEDGTVTYAPTTQGTRDALQKLAELLPTIPSAAGSA